MPHNRYAQLRMITPEAIRDTVLYDGQTRLWFLKLCSLPEVENRLREASPSASAHYRLYRILSLVALALLLSALIIFMAAALSSRTDALRLTAAGIVVTGVAIVFLLKRRHPIAELSAGLIRLEASRFPPGMTLYQMGEVFARTYGLPSLIDTIWRWDQWTRNVFLAIYFATFGVFFLPFWQMILWSVLGGSAAVLAVRALLMLKAAPARPDARPQATT
jgi:hypothetical protein